MRTAEFDREVVLRQAMDAFLTKGYSKTSVQDLKNATGLHPGSLYCAFSNKRGILLAALDQYSRQSREDLLHIFECCDSVLDGFQAYLDTVVEECEQEEIKDCLLQKSLTDVIAQDEDVAALINQMLSQWHDVLKAQLVLAQQNKELSAEKDPQALSEFIVMSIYGIRTFSHTDPEPGSLNRLSHQVMEFLRR